MEAKQIVKVIENYFNMEEGVVYKKIYSDDIVKARNMAIYFLSMNDWTHKEIGKFFDMNRTSIYNPLKCIKNWVKNDRIIRNQFFELKDLIFNNEEPEDEIDVEADDILSDVYGKIKKVTTQIIEE